MGGMFGGILSLVNAIGGCILYVLIGSIAWKDKKDARDFRIGMGGFALGTIVGAVVYMWVLDNRDNKLPNLVVAVVGGLIGFMVLASLLDWIRTSIIKEDTDSK